LARAVRTCADPVKVRTVLKSVTDELLGVNVTGSGCRWVGLISNK
jgi:hypothetical protein